MKVESPSFTNEDLVTFMDEILLVDVRHTADRLRAAGTRVFELAAEIPEASSDDVAWNAKEILAHIAVLSRAYGVFAYMVAHDRLTTLPLEGVITQRDPTGEAMAALTVAEIVAEIHKHHDRTLKFLATATPEQLRKSVATELGPITAESLIRLPLVAHMEDHVVQLAAALA